MPYDCLYAYSRQKPDSTAAFDVRLSAVGAGHVLGCERALLDPPAPVSRARNAASSVAPPAVIRHCETATATTNQTALVMRVGGAMLLILGVLMITGLWNEFTIWLRVTLPGFETAL